MPTINASVSVVGSINALQSISVLGNTAGATSAGPGSLALAGGSNATLSGATAVGGMTLSINASAAGQADAAFQAFSTGLGGSVIGIRQTGRPPQLIPFSLTRSLTWNQLAYVASITNVAGVACLRTMHAGIYSYSNSTKLGLIASQSYSYSFDFASASKFTTPSLYTLPGVGGASTLAPGPYVLGLFHSGDGNSGNILWRYYAANCANVLGVISQGNESFITGVAISSVPIDAPFAGWFSATATTGLPASIDLSSVNHQDPNVSATHMAWFQLRST